MYNPKKLGVFGNFTATDKLLSIFTAISYPRLSNGLRLTDQFMWVEPIYPL